MDIVLRGIVVFAFLLLLTRIIGRRELSSLQPFDLILLIILGDAVQQGLTQDDYSLTGPFLAIGTIAVLQVLVSWVGYRFPKARPILEGVPIVVVQDGEVIERNLKRERLTAEEVAEEARLQNIAHLADVRFAILETNGRRWHDDAIDFERDQEKWSVPGHHGYRVILATWSKVTERPDDLIEELRISCGGGARRGGR